MHSFDRYIALASSLAAVITSGATFLVLKQMRLQREATYRPQISIGRCYFKGETPETPSRSNSVLGWTHDMPTNPSASGEGIFDFPIYNIGLGAARNVRITWDLTVESPCKTIHELCSRSNTPISMTMENGWLAINIPDLGYIDSHNVLAQNHTSFPHIAPINVETHGVLTAFPPVLISLFGILLALGDPMVKGRDGFPLICVPMHIQFSDIDGSEHCTSYSVSINLTSVTRAHLGESVSGYTGFINFAQTT